MSACDVAVCALRKPHCGGVCAARAGAVAGAAGGAGDAAGGDDAEIAHRADVGVAASEAALSLRHNHLYGPLADYGGHNIAAMAVDSKTGQVRVCAERVCRSVACVRAI